MRRLPKQLTLLDWTRSRLSTRRSKSWRVQLWPRRCVRLLRWLRRCHCRLRRVPMRQLPKPLVLLECEQSRLSTRRSKEWWVQLWPRQCVRLLRWLRRCHCRLRRVPMRQLPKPLVLLECEQSRLSTRRSKEWWVQLWPRQCVRLLRWLRRCHCRLRRVPMSSCQSRLSCSNGSGAAFLHEEASSGGCSSGLDDAFDCFGCAASGRGEYR